MIAISMQCPNQGTVETLPIHHHPEFPETSIIRRSWDCNQLSLQSSFDCCFWFFNSPYYSWTDSWWLSRYDWQDSYSYMIGKCDNAASCVIIESLCIKIIRKINHLFYSRINRLVDVKIKDLWIYVALVSTALLNPCFDIPTFRSFVTYGTHTFSKGLFA